MADPLTIPSELPPPPPLAGRKRVLWLPKPPAKRRRLAAGWKTPEHLYEWDEITGVKRKRVGGDESESKRRRLGLGGWKIPEHLLACEEEKDVTSEDGEQKSEEDSTTSDESIDLSEEDLSELFGESDESTASIETEATVLETDEAPEDSETATKCAAASPPTAETTPLKRVPTPIVEGTPDAEPIATAEKEEASALGQENELGSDSATTSESTKSRSDTQPTTPTAPAPTVEDVPDEEWTKAEKEASIGGEWMELESDGTTTSESTEPQLSHPDSQPATNDVSQNTSSSSAAQMPPETESATVEEEGLADGEENDAGGDSNTASTPSAPPAVESFKRPRLARPGCRPRPDPPAAPLPTAPPKARPVQSRDAEQNSQAPECTKKQPPEGTAAQEATPGTGDTTSEPKQSSAETESTAAAQSGTTEQEAQPLASSKKRKFDDTAAPPAVPAYSDPYKPSRSSPLSQCSTSPQEDAESGTDEQKPQSSEPSSKKQKTEPASPESPPGTDKTPSQEKQSQKFPPNVPTLAEIAELEETLRKEFRAVKDERKTLASKYASLPLSTRRGVHGEPKKAMSRLYCAASLQRFAPEDESLPADEICPEDTAIWGPFREAEMALDYFESRKKRDPYYERFVRRCLADATSNLNNIKAWLDSLEPPPKTSTGPEEPCDVVVILVWNKFCQLVRQGQMIHVAAQEAQKLTDMLTSVGKYAKAGAGTRVEIFKYEISLIAYSAGSRGKYSADEELAKEARASGQSRSGFGNASTFGFASSKGSGSRSSPYTYSASNGQSSKPSTPFSQYKSSTSSGHSSSQFKPESDAKTPPWYGPEEFHSSGTTGFRGDARKTFFSDEDEGRAGQSNGDQNKENFRFGAGQSGRKPQSSGGSGSGSGTNGGHRSNSQGSNPFSSYRSSSSGSFGGGGTGPQPFTSSPNTPPPQSDFTPVTPPTRPGVSARGLSTVTMGDALSWLSRCDNVFADMSTLTALPLPPHSNCGSAACQADRSPALPACRCDLLQLVDLIKQNKGDNIGDRVLRKLRHRWHPNNSHWNFVPQNRRAAAYASRDLISPLLNSIIYWM